MANLDGTDDVFDSRDVVERINELTQILEDPEFYNDGDSDEADELSALTALRDEFDHREFEDGITLISEADFENYARELAEDIGAYNPDAGWPNGYIDWAGAAQALQMDYTPVVFHGETYWGRA